MDQKLPKRKTKDRIFEAAIELFSKKGYHAASMRDIAQKVGIKESSLYYHYPEKSAILDAILMYQISCFKAAIPTREEMETTAAKFTDVVELWVTGIIDFMQKLPPLYESISQIIYNEMFLNEQCRTFVHNSLFSLQKDVTIMLLQDLLSKGMIKECNVQMTAEQYVYMLYGLEIEQRIQFMEGHSRESLQRDLLSHITFFIENLKS